ncbi:MAG: twin-arginine translocation signal domain-containing protein, partial [Burkholderiales bacterium]
MNTRREFLQGSAGGTLTALGVLGAPLPASASSEPDSGSDIGSLYPFVKSQAVAGEFPLSFLQKEFTDLRAWKARARAKVLELLHYAPPPCDPRAEVVERVDRGDYVQERV